MNTLARSKMAPFLLAAALASFTIDRALGGPDPSSVSFTAAGTYLVSDFGDDIVAADLNADGKLDLIVPNWAYPTVTVFLGNGDGSFQDGVEYSTGSKTFPEYAVAGDFDRDGKLDIALASQSNVAVLPGNGDGTFGAAKNSNSGLTAVQDPVLVRSADINNDGILDLFAEDVYGKTYVLLGRGAFTFSNRGQIGSAGLPLVADFNGDGNIDVLLSGLRLGQGDGTFGPSSGKWDPGDWSQVADFNGDGKPDVVGPNFRALLNDGQGSFRAIDNVLNGSLVTPTNTILLAGISPRAITTADFNGDGLPDVVFVDGGRGHQGLAIALSNGDGTFQGTVPLSAVSTSTPGLISAPGLVIVDPSLGNQNNNLVRCITAADFNGDGKPDLAVAVWEDNQVPDIRIYLNMTPWPPRLMAAAKAGGSIVLSWPAAATGYTIESSTGLAPAHWQPVAPAPMPANGVMQVTLPATGTMQFFRLRQP